MKPGKNNNQSLGKNPLLSFFLSLLVHALLILIVCSGLLHLVTQGLSPHKLEAEKENLPEIVLDLSPPPPETRATIQTASADPLEKAPNNNTSFESHENTEASSELAPTGNLPLPEQEGNEDDLIELNSPKSDTRTQTTASTESSAEEESDYQKTTSTTLPKTELPSSKQVESTTQEPVIGKLSHHTRGETSGSHPSMIHGAISNKGKSSVAAEATPIGRYKKTLSDAISSRWYYSIDQRMALLSFGSAILRFYVNKEGKIEELHLLSNSSNQTFADCCLQSITEAKLPIIPAEIAKTLEKGRLEIEYRFTIYPD
jgi:hypothetical protein